MTKRKLIIICLALFTLLLVLVVVGIWSSRNGHRLISGHSYAQFIPQNEAQDVYDNAVQALEAGSGSRMQSGKPHYLYNLQIGYGGVGFEWEFRPGFIENTFESAANPSTRGAAIEASLIGQGWTMQNEESLQTFITKAMNKREREVADLQAAALNCGEKKYCLEDKEDKLTVLNDKPLTINVYLTKNPYKLYLEYELYPTDETAKLEAKLQYGCSEPSDEYCRR